MCTIFQRSICNKTNSRMECLCIPQCIHGHPNLPTPQLRLYALQRTLEDQLEVNLLRCHAGGNVPWELGRRLDGFDP